MRGTRRGEKERKMDGESYNEKEKNEESRKLNKER